MHATQPSKNDTGRNLRWLLALPKLGLVLLICALIALLWLLRHNEQEEERTSLIKDVLWLEQNLRFHLNGVEEQLQQLSIDLADQPEPRKIFRLRAAHLTKNTPEVSQLLWLSAEHQVLEGLPNARLPDEAISPSMTARNFEIAQRLAKQTYSEPFFSGREGAQIELATPIFRDKKFTGMLIAVLPLETLLGNLVPWWFTEKYKVQIVDDNDVQYASKTRIQGPHSQVYEIPFDPPGYGLRLRVTSYQAGTSPLQSLLTAAIVVLALGVTWSLWIVRNLMKQRTQAEEALRAEHAFRTAMENSLTVGMRARDLNGKIIYVNPAFCKMTGFSSEQLVGTIPPMPYWIPEQLEEAYAMHQAVLAGEAPPDGFEMTFRRANGERFEALVYEARLIDGNGRHTGWMASVLDITERRRAEELARQQQEQLQFTSRLVTMGEMASTLAHELNQPLAAIASYNSGCLNLLQNPDCQANEIRPALEKIGVQAQRAGKIIRRVHDFVRKSEPKRAPCQVAEVIEDCLGFVEAEARKRQTQIESQLPPTLPCVPADRLMLEQVLLNLIRNAMEAMNETPASMRLLKVAAWQDGQEIRICVADQGTGITAETQQKLFTAFFTTKPEGMGVGLSICRSIIEFHRGRLWVEDNLESATGQGASFYFTLPLEESQ